MIVIALTKSTHSFGRTIKMINELTTLYADALVSHGIISRDQKEIHIYGLAALIINILNYSVFILLGICFGFALETIIFFFFYVSLRNIIGGRHASSPISCLLYGVLMWILMILIYNHVHLTYLIEFIISFILFASLPLIIHKKEIAFIRKQVGIILLTAQFFTSVILLLLNSPLSFLITLSIFSNLIMNLYLFPTALDKI